MRRLPVLLLTIVAAAVLSACSAGAAPGWTYAPAASATPVARPARRIRRSRRPAASTAPSGAASVAPSSAALRWRRGSDDHRPRRRGHGRLRPDDRRDRGGRGLHADVRQPRQPGAAQPRPPEPGRVEGRGPGRHGVLHRTRHSATYQVPALTAGDYKYICQVHPTTMIGTLTVK